MVSKPVPPVDRLSSRSGPPRPPGARALQTRERLIEMTTVLLGEVPFKDLTSALVTQRLGLTPPAFYRYFSDITEAIAACAESMRGNVDGIADVILAGNWRRTAAVDAASGAIEAMATFWRQHRALYRVIDLLADEGDPRFVEARRHTFESMTAAFTKVMADVPGRDPAVAAGVVVATLVHVTAREAGFTATGIERATLRRHLADQIAVVVTGGRPR